MSPSCTNILAKIAISSAFNLQAMVLASAVIAAVSSIEYKISTSNIVLYKLYSEEEGKVTRFYIESAFRLLDGIFRVKSLFGPYILVA